MKVTSGFGLTRSLVAASLLVSSLAFHAAVAAADGAAIFTKNCAACHGTDGKGSSALGTPNFTDPKWQSSIKDTEIRETIKNGKKGTAMVGFADRFKDEEISALMAYIRSLDSSKKK
jgi:cytochrome c oxidase cbb3-type subunit 3